MCKFCKVDVDRDTAGAIPFKVGGSNLKVGGPKFFIDFSPRKVCRE